MAREEVGGVVVGGLSRCVAIVRSIGQQHSSNFIFVFNGLFAEMLAHSPAVSQPSKLLQTYRTCDCSGQQTTMLRRRSFHRLADWIDWLSNGRLLDKTVTWQMKARHSALVVSIPMRNRCPADFARRQRGVWQPFQARRRWIAMLFGCKSGSSCTWRQRKVCGAAEQWLIATWGRVALLNGVGAPR